jgi:hypothetical protein
VALPGPITTSRDAGSPRTALVQTGTWYVAGAAERGPVGVAVPCNSLRAFRAKFGANVAYSKLAPAVEAFFRLGGRRVVVSRVVGPDASTGTVALKDAANADTLTVTAKAPVDAGITQAIKVETVTGGVRISYLENGSVVEVSPTLADNAAAVAWNSDNVIVTDIAGSALTPKPVASSPLVGNDDDRAGITASVQVAALDVFDYDLGPGQVSIPGAASDAVIAGLFAHAFDGNRRVVGDLPDTDDVATLVAAAKVARDLGETGTCGGLFAPVALCAGRGGTTLEVPYSAVQAALFATNDAIAPYNPNRAAAGRFGVPDPRYVLGVKYAWNKVDRETLNDAGVNVARVVTRQGIGEVRTYGNVTPADRESYPEHWQLSNVRCDMALRYEAEAIGEDHVHAVIDGEGEELASYKSSLDALCDRFYRAGALYGPTAEDAFRVDVADPVNTTDSIAEGRIRAVLSAKRSRSGEVVELETVTVALTASV